MNLEKLFVHPNAYCYWLTLIVLFTTNQNSPGPIRLYRNSPVYSSLPGINNAMHWAGWPADYLVLSGALGKPCTSVMYS